jgi:hypothetical protein
MPRRWIGYRLVALLTITLALAPAVGRASPLLAQPGGAPPGAMVIVSDPLSAPSTALTFPRFEGDDTTYFRYQNGLLALEHPYGVPPRAVVTGTYRDVAIAVDARLSRFPAGNYIILACRSSSAGHYRLLVDPNSMSYRLRRVGGVAEVPLAIGPSTAIQPGTEWNRIELRCTGPTISVAINGAELGSFHDDTLAEGTVWFSAAAYGNVATLTDARFRDLTVWQPGPGGQ